MIRKALITLSLLCLTATARAYDFSATAPSGQTLYFNVTGSSASVTYMSSDNSFSSNQSYVSGNLVIPSAVSNNGMNYPVTSIGENAFYFCNGLTSVVIPATVYSIGNCAFHYCFSLASVTIPNSVLSIGHSAFYCCNVLDSVTLPNSVTSIEFGAFGYCRSLSSINIPSTVLYIGVGAFRGCDSLASITVSPSNATFDSRNNCNAIINSSSNSLIAGCSATVIPNTVTSIYDMAFMDLEEMTFLSIPNSITSIGSFAFRSCSSLSPLVIPSSVTSIANNAFDGVDTIIYCGSLSGRPWGAGYSYCDSCAYENQLFYDTLSLCSNSFPLYWRDTIFYYPTPMGDFSFLRQSHIGCDSIVLLHLDVHDISERDVYDTTILGATYEFPGIQISTIGDYQQTHTFSDIIGCDSVVTLHLTVLDSVVYLPDTVFHPQVTVSIGTLFNWQGNAYGTMQVESADMSMGRVIGGDGYYKDGDVMQIYAFPKNGYKFEIWSDGVVQNPRSIAVSPSTRNIVYTAEFSAANAANQQTTDNNDGVETTSTKRIFPVDCGNNFLTIRNISQYNGYGQRIVTTHVFDTMLLCEDTVDLGDDALFRSFTVMSANSSRGQVIGGDGRYVEWQQTRIAAIPYQGYKFDHWGDNNTDNPRYVTMNKETQNKIYMAYFTGENAIDVVNDGIRVYTSKGDVIIECAEGRCIAVFDMLGRQFFNSEITSSQFIIHNSKFPVSGVYLVKVDSITAAKVTIIK